MPMTQGDMQMLTSIVGQIVAAVMAATQAQVQPEAAAPERRERQERVGERHFRTLVVFGGDAWRDWSFQFRSAARSSSEVAYTMLSWAESETTIDDFSGVRGVGDETATRIPGMCSTS
jgi:hypothetical protein